MTDKRSEGQFVQMIKARDLLKHVDMNDLPYKNKNEFDALRTKPGGKKSISRIAAEKKILSQKLETAKKPGINPIENAVRPKSTDPSLMEDIKRRGVQEALDVGATGPGQMTLWNGHHRLATQMSIDPEGELPVRFHE